MTTNSPPCHEQDAKGPPDAVTGLELRIAQLEALTRLQQRMLNESVNQIANAWVAIHQLAAMLVGAGDQIPGEQPLSDGVAPRH